MSRASPVPSSPPLVRRPRRAGRRYHFGSPGIIYIAVTVFVALGAFNSQNNLLFWTFGVAIATLIVSGVVSGAMLMGLDAGRVIVSSPRVGEVLHITYEIRNRNRFTPAFALRIRELEAPLDMPLSGSGAPAGRRRIGQRLLDLVRLPRLAWRWLRAFTQLPLACVFVPHVPPQGRTRVTMSVPATRRGRVRLRAIELSTSFPFGLVRKSLVFVQPGEVLVYPQPIPPDPTLLGGARAYGQAERPTQRQGPGGDFFALRAYRPGDPLRDIAWRASARRSQFLVRQTTTAAPAQVVIVLALRAALGSTDRDERAISLAAGLVEEARRRGLVAGLAVPLTGLVLLPGHGGAGPSQFDRLQSALAELELGADDGRGRDVPALQLDVGRSSRTIVLHAQSQREAEAAVLAGEQGANTTHIYLSPSPAAPATTSPAHSRTPIAESVNGRTPVAGGAA